MNSKAISAASLFALPESAMDGDAVAVLTVKKNQVLFAKGDAADRLYRIVSGQVALYNEDRAKSIELLGPDTLFGEEALFGSIRLFAAKMLTEGQIAVLDPAKIHNLQPVMQLAMQSMADRQNRLIEELSSLKSLPPLQRLARLILSMPQITAGEIKVQLPWRKNLIAEQIGVRQETLSRLLPGLQDHGAYVNGNWITITDLPALHQFGAGDPGHIRMRKAAC